MIFGGIIPVRKIVVLWIRLIEPNDPWRGNRMWRPGFAEILIVLVIVILLFGPGRIAKVAKEIGASITAFKEGLNEDSDKKKTSEQTQSDDENAKSNHP